MSAGLAPPRLRMRAIEKRFGGTLALAGVDLEVCTGEVHALVGENGAGKSTLMKVLAGALRADGGAMELDGVRYEPSSPAAARRAGVAMIHQELSLAPHLSVAENVLLGAEPRRGPLVERRELRERARSALAPIGAGHLDLDLPVRRLPLADRQRVEIARALAFDARVIVLDEPTSSLDREDAGRLFREIRRLRERGASFVYISHVLEEVLAVADRYTVLRDGRSVASGPIEGATPQGIVGAMVGRAAGELYPHSGSGRTPGETILSLEGLGGTRFPRRATLSVRRGEVLGIAGLVGAGRTELLRAIFGLDPVRRGTLRVLALEGPREPRERWRSGVGFLSEDRKREGLALARAVGENLCWPVLGKLGRLGFVAPAAVDRTARVWIERLRIRCREPRQPAGALSGGNQQKVALARLLAADVDLLLLDEPTRGVDVGAKAELYRWIDQLTRERGKAVVLVSSHLPELLGVADRVAVMARGELGPARPVGELDEHALLLEATSGGGT